MISLRGRAFAISMVLAIAVLLTLTNAAQARTEGPTQAAPQGGSRSIVHLKFRDEVRARLEQGRFVGNEPEELERVNALIDDADAARSRLFTQPEGDIDRRRAGGEARTGEKLPDLNSYFRITLPPQGDAEAVTADLNEISIIETAYPAPQPAPPTTTPSFENLQGYVKAAPKGIGSGSTTTYPGGTGSNVRVVDIEYSWNTAHEDLSKARLPGALIPNGTPVDTWGDKNHGTAVLGEIAADANGLGVTGITPNVSIHMTNASNSERGWDLHNSIAVAVAALSPGDVILIEQQTWGPNGSYVPVEWIPAVYDSIKTATAAGVIVVEAAGNGGQNLDDASLYGSPFPSGKPDSGAIIVGAGAACGNEGAPSRSRLSYSNYGQRVNVQGWGECVTTTGYGNLAGGANPNLWYTSSFSGTSSASPIVAAAAVAFSSAYEQLNGTSPSPALVRSSLRSTGTPQDLTSPGAQPGTIGPLPNLAKALKKADLTPPTAPSNLTAALNASKKVVLSWGESTDNVSVVAYRIYRDGKLIKKISATASTFTDTAAAAGKTYQYKVSAVDIAQRVSAFSNTVTITTPST